MKKHVLKLYYLGLNIIEKFRIGSNYVQMLVRNPPLIMNTDETIEKLLNSECSMSRFGDGEFGMLAGEDIIFQKNSPVFKKKLKEVLQSTSENHITGVPYAYKSLDNFRDESVKYIKRFLLQKGHAVFGNLKKDKIYYDSLVTRLYADYKDRSAAGTRFERIKKIWADKNLIIVEGKKSRLGVGNDFFDNSLSIKRIICPAFNAFDKYFEIIEKVKEVWIPDSIVLIALGPTATLLAYDLSQIGIRALDIGHIDVEYEWYKMGAEYKVPLKNKTAGDDMFIPSDEFEDKTYISSIICKII